MMCGVADATAAMVMCGGVDVVFFSSPALLPSPALFSVHRAHSAHSPFGAPTPRLCDMPANPYRRSCVLARSSSRWPRLRPTCCPATSSMPRRPSRLSPCSASWDTPSTSFPRCGPFSRTTEDFECALTDSCVPSLSHPSQGVRRHSTGRLQ